jgi:SAM-dependent methyltransferase
MINYYELHANEYINQTISCDMSFHYDIFLKHITEDARILDIGFGSGRDMFYFESKGYKVAGIDPTLSFYNNMKEKGYDVYHIPSEYLSFVNEFDAIWACASLLHVQRCNLHDVLIKCNQALKDDGIMYCSFKYGDFETVRNERYFNYLNEQSFSEILKDTGFTILETYITGDVRADRASEQWLNVVMKKMNRQ